MNQTKNLNKNSREQKIYVLIGPPACGKSTLARKMHKEDPNKVIVNRDDIRDARGNYWIPDQEGYISDIEEAEVRSAITHGLSPIIDATNLNPKTIEKWENLSIELEVDLDKIYLPYVPFKVALERDRTRGMLGGREVGEKTLRSFYERYYFDRYKEEELIDDVSHFVGVERKLPYAVVVDLDSTVAYRNGRVIYDYNASGNDIFDPRMKIILENLLKGGIKILFITGREERSKNVVDEWLHKHLTGLDTNYKLIMRKDLDHRKSNIVKEELLKTVEDKFNILIAFDDDPDCAMMYKNHNIYSCLANYGISYYTKEE